MSVLPATTAGAPFAATRCSTSTSKKNAPRPGAAAVNDSPPAPKGFATPAIITTDFFSDDFNLDKEDSMTASSAQADFRLLKSRVTLPMIFAHIGGLELHQQGRELRGICPFCKDQTDKPSNGKGRRRAFAVNLEKQTYYCHACKKGGDIIKFVAEYDGCTIKDAGLKIQEWFGTILTDGEPTSVEPTLPEQPHSNITHKETGVEISSLPELLQAVLSELRQIRRHLEKGSR
jgi:hypothetical protein